MVIHQSADQNFSPIPDSFYLAYELHTTYVTFVYSKLKAKLSWFPRDGEYRTMSYRQVPSDETEDVIEAQNNEDAAAYDDIESGRNSRKVLWLQKLVKIPYLPIIVAVFVTIIVSFCAYAIKPEKVNEKRIIVLMISDGMGPASLSMARGLSQYRTGNKSHLLELDPYLVGTVRTRSYGKFNMLFLQWHENYLHRQFGYGLGSRSGIGNPHVISHTY